MTEYNLSDARAEEEAKTKKKEFWEALRIDRIANSYSDPDECAAHLAVPPPPPASKNKDKEEKKRLIIPTYKYSKIGKGDLYESVILGGIPTFLRYDKENNKIVPYQSIEEETRILR